MSHKKFVRSEELLHYDRLLRQHVAVVALAINDAQCILTA